MIEDGVACGSRTAIWPIAAMLTHHNWSWIRCKLMARCCEAAAPWEDRSTPQLEMPSEYTRSLPSSVPYQILSVQSESCHVRLLTLGWIRRGVCRRKRHLITWTSQLTCLTVPTTRREPWSTFWTMARPSSPPTPYHRNQLKKQQPLSIKRSVTLMPFAYKQSRQVMISSLLRTNVRSDSISWANPSVKVPSERSNSVVISPLMKR